MGEPNTKEGEKMAAENFKWCIRESSHGGVVADYGIPHAGGVQIGSMPGVTMPAFLVYYSASFPTKKAAERFIAKNPDPLKKKPIGF